jgi:hypothetical protein
MGQGFSISNSKVYIDNGQNNNNGNHVVSNHSPSGTPQSSGHAVLPQNKSFQNNVTVIPISSFKNKLRVYQNFETSEVLVLLDCDINEFPGFTKSEAEEWYEVRICHQQEKYFESFTSALSNRHVQNEHWINDSTGSLSDTAAGSGGISDTNGGGVVVDKRFLKSPKWNQQNGKRLNKDKENVLETPSLSPLNLMNQQNALAAARANGTGSGRRTITIQVAPVDRDKVESIPPLQNLGLLQQQGQQMSGEIFPAPTHTVSSLLTPHANDSGLEPNHSNEICPFCKENLNEEDGSKHMCDCINSHNIQERFQESDKLLQEVTSPPWTSSDQISSLPLLLCLVF